MDWLKTLVPVLGTALGGPLGGAAAAFIAKKLGITNETVEAVSEVLSSNKLSPEQISALKLAETDFLKFLEENKIKIEEIHAGDRSSARNMQVAVRSKIPGWLAIIIVVGFFAILVGLMGGILNVADSQALMILLGALSAGFGAVLNFYYGSSSGSQSKDLLLAQSRPDK
jgi:hypothetical protein